MPNKPPSKPVVPIKLEDLDDEFGYYVKVDRFIDQLDPVLISQHLRDVFSNELAFLDVPEALDFIDHDTVADEDNRITERENEQTRKKTGTSN
ncbi:MAG: hypothetical protein SFW65_04880 [Alphaproteobacteria bacterium]|nr:hypothetical protein [Alphaproteobacteria bacterium]